MGLFSAIGSLFGAGKAKKAAAKYAEQAKFKPFNFNLGGIGSTSFDGQTVTGSLSSEYQNLRNNLFGLANTAGSRLGNLPDLFGNLQQEAALANNTPVGFNPNNDLYNRGLSYFDKAAGVSQPDPNSIYNTFGDRLGLLRNLSKASEGQFFQNNLDNQYANGVLASSAGQYQTQAALEALNQADTQRQLTAYGMASDDYSRQAQAQQALAQLFAGMGSNATGLGLQQALSQYGSDRNNVMDRFARALELFQSGQSDAAFQGTLMNNALQGIGGIDSILPNLAQMGANFGSQQSSANAQAYAPTVAAAQQQANAFAALGQGIDSAFNPFAALSGFFRTPGINPAAQTGPTVGSAYPNW